MKRIVLTLATMFVLFKSSAAHAAMPIEYKNYPPDTQGGPTVLFCSASASLGQKCRKCYENFWPNGTTMNWVCVAVSSNATCKCIMGTETKSCTGEGECYYFN